MSATDVDLSSTLGDIVNRHPSLARELERRSLDYCCGGARTLAEACAAAGLDPVATAAELQAAPTEGTASWVDLGPGRLVDHIEATHHAYLHDELPRLSALVDKVVGVHAGRHPELVEVARVYGELRADLEPHLVKEERILFPMVRELDGSEGMPDFHCGSLGNPISVMRFEHDRAGELLAGLRSAAGDYVPPDDACASYTALYAGLEALEADTHLHIHKENNLLFPAVVQMENERVRG